MLKLSLIHLFIIGVFLIVAVQSRICRKEVTKTWSRGEVYNNTGDGNSTSPPSIQSKTRHAKKTLMITYYCREEDDTEISEKEAKRKDCKANCNGYCVDGNCTCLFGDIMINNTCVNFCEQCNRTGICLHLMLCKCQFGVVRYAEVYPPLVNISSPATSTKESIDSSSSAPDLKIGDTIENDSLESNSTRALSRDEATKRRLNGTDLTIDQPSATNHIVKPISTESVVNSKSKSNELEQASVTSRVQHNGVSIIISIILGNSKSGNQNALLGDCQSGN